MSPPLSFGGLFRRKEKKSPEVSQGAARMQSNDSNRLTISKALDLLEKIENEKVDDMSRNLIPIRESLENILLSIGRLAEEMEAEKVKVEEEKLKVQGKYWSHR
jgi:hypothetical protein